MGFAENLRTPDAIVLACCADENYAIPLAVAIRSTLDSLQPNQPVRLFVIDAGILAATKDRLAESWDDSRLSLTWLQATPSLFDDLPTQGHLTRETYYRLSLPELIPAEYQKVIYLDADMLVRQDLRGLWDEPIGQHAVLAVQDFAAPFIDSSIALSNYNACHRYLSSAVPIANYESLGLSPNSVYFNGGLLVMNLERWRRENIASSVMNCLRENRRYVLWADQYALNAVLDGQWGLLDPRWNQGASIHGYPHWRASPFEAKLFDELREHPWIVHFCSNDKPWNYYCNHPFAGEFRHCIANTAWKSFRPPEPVQRFRTWWRYTYKPTRKRIFDTATRLTYSVKALGRAA